MHTLTLSLCCSTHMLYVKPDASCSKDFSFNCVVEQQGESGVRASGAGASRMDERCSPTAPSMENRAGPGGQLRARSLDKSTAARQFQVQTKTWAHGLGQGRNGPWPGRSTAATSAGGAEHQSLSWSSVVKLSICMRICCARLICRNNHHKNSHTV